MRILLTAASCILAGCAGYSITDESKENRGKQGYVVYEPAPHLLVSRTKEGKPLGAQLVWLPNYKKGYRIKSWSGLSKATFSFDIASGWMLKSINAQSDNTALGEKLLSYLPKAGSGGLNAFVKQAGGDNANLYRIFIGKETTLVPVDDPVKGQK